MCPPRVPWTCRCPCWKWGALAGLNLLHTPYLASLYPLKARSVWSREDSLCLLMPFSISMNCDCLEISGSLFLFPFSHIAHFVTICLVFTKISLDWYLPLQLPHGLPPTSLTLETEVEKRFLQDPSWLPIHDKDLAFQKFLKYRFLQKLPIVVQLTKTIWEDVSLVFFFLSGWLEEKLMSAPCSAAVHLRFTQGLLLLEIQPQECYWTSLR